MNRRKFLSYIGCSCCGLILNACSYRLSDLKISNICLNMLYLPIKMIKNGNAKNNVSKYIIGINLFFIDCSAIHSASFIGISFNRGLRNIIIIPKILKNKWANDATIAVTLSVSDANNAVTVVPRFAPNVNGYNCRRVTIPAPAKGTIVDVVMDEL